jgi:predicted peptidase
MPLARALRLHGPLAASAAALATREFIIVAPQLLIGGDLWGRYADVVRQIVSEVRSEYGGDPRRLYLTGFSFGANGVFDLALLEPGFWAALWPVDPTRLPQRDPKRPIWLSFGEVARQRKAAFIRALRLEPAQGAPQGERLYLDRGEDHVGCARRAYSDDIVYSWLLGKQCN